MTNQRREDGRSEREREMTMSSSLSAPRVDSGRTTSTRDSLSSPRVLGLQNQRGRPTLSEWATTEERPYSYRPRAARAHLPCGSSLDPGFTVQRTRTWGGDALGQELPSLHHLASEERRYAGCIILLRWMRFFVRSYTYHQIALSSRPTNSGSECHLVADTRCPLSYDIS